MKDEIMLLLGCGLAAVLVTSACSSMYENEDEHEEEHEFKRYKPRKMDRLSRYEYEGYSNCDGGRPAVEQQPMPVIPPAPEKFSVDYYTEPKKEEKPTISPLLFSGLVTNEPYLESDYIAMNDYTDNPDGIKVYNEKDGSVGLPVNDMTSISAGENNKYVYDRTIGTIGFTSTKIGGRFRGQADYIRGDIPVLPDKTGWFQVSSDPANKLMLGAMNVANGIGQTPKPPKKKGGRAGAANALETTAPVTLDSLRAKQSGGSSGSGSRMQAMDPNARAKAADDDHDDGPSVLQIMQAGYNQYKADAKAIGTTYIAGNPY